MSEKFSFYPRYISPLEGEVDAAGVGWGVRDKAPARSTVCHPGKLQAGTQFQDVCHPGKLQAGTQSSLYGSRLKAYREDKYLFNI